MCSLLLILLVWISPHHPPTRVKPLLARKTKEAKNSQEKTQFFVGKKTFRKWTFFRNVLKQGEEKRSPRTARAYRRLGIYQSWAPKMDFQKMAICPFCFSFWNDHFLPFYFMGITPIESSSAFFFWHPCSFFLWVFLSLGEVKAGGILIWTWTQWEDVQCPIVD